MTRLSATLLLLLAAFPALLPAAPGAVPGAPAPDFELKDTSGAGLRLSSLRGEVVVLHFWATWCPHCLTELPLLDGMIREEPYRSVRVLAINLGESERKVKSYLQKHPLGLRVLLDSRGKVAAEYGVIGLPASVVLDSSGRLVRQVSMGSLDQEGLGKILGPLLQEQAGAGPAR
jgi:peroxiredoxin